MRGANRLPPPACSCVGLCRKAHISKNGLHMKEKALNTHEFNSYFCKYPLLLAVYACLVVFLCRTSWISKNDDSLGLIQASYWFTSPFFLLFGYILKPNHSLTCSTTWTSLDETTGSTSVLS